MATETDAPMTVEEARREIKEFFSRPDAELAKVRDAEEGGMKCVYRGNDDPSSPLRCAFGCLLPDELYDPSLEGSSLHACLPQRMGMSASWQRVREHFFPEGLPGDYIAARKASALYAFLFDAQQAHDADSTETVEQFLVMLDEVAVEHGIAV